MPEATLLDRIVAAGSARATGAESAPEGSEPEERFSKFIVVSVLKKRYAIPASAIREIVIDVPIHYVPFMPPYVRGFVNRHGEPYTVLDLGVLFDQEATVERSFLVLNLPDDQLAFLVSDIHEIVRVPESVVFPITENRTDAGFFRASVRLREQDIFVVAVDGIRQRMAEGLVRR